VLHRPNETILYSKGLLDVLFVGFHVIVWTFLRAFSIDYILKPLAKRMNTRPGLWDRFGEQGWLAFYYTPSFLTGMVCVHC
jgi:acyl-CoA-dependent ceramide synthase